MFLLEVPSNVAKRSRAPLSMCSLLPSRDIAVTAHTLEGRRPRFVDRECTRIEMVAYSELLNSARWLRALADDRFSPRGEQYSPEHDPSFDEIELPECFELLVRYGLRETTPSFSQLFSVASFLDTQFGRLKEYSLLMSGALCYCEGLEAFKHVFVQVQHATKATLKGAPPDPI